MGLAASGSPRVADTRDVWAVALGPALERDIDRITKSEDGVPTKLA